MKNQAVFFFGPATGLLFKIINELAIACQKSLSFPHLILAYSRKTLHESSEIFAEHVGQCC